ncbi:CDP-archaeol synthase, partial [uncultured Methanobrevibacter sp.]|uniref:CDP-archaeol synthase n=1 Tax=uncultured Methanobrevibacter sp. TaxID=253161 RepID=UPI0025DF760C
PFLDQLDFVCGALVFSLLVVPLSLDFVLLIMAISIVLHLGSNTFAYLIGMKDVWY